jgi:hypothetical protein
MTTIDRARLRQLHAQETQLFIDTHPQSAALYQRAQYSLLGGVPMNWMKKWAGPFPIFVKSASGAHFTDVDDSDYIDLCLGDTGAMTGHSPKLVADAVARRVREGITLMLPTEDSVGLAKSSAAASAFRSGSSLSPLPTQTASRFASLAKLRSALRSWSSTIATTVLSTNPSPPSLMRSPELSVPAAATSARPSIPPRPLGSSSSTIWPRSNLLSSTTTSPASSPSPP